MAVLSISDVVGKACQFDGCKEPATHLAVGRDYGDEKGHLVPAFYCAKHSSEITNEGWPEYEHECVNCGCRQGVN